MELKLIFVKVAECDILNLVVRKNINIMFTNNAARDITPYVTLLIIKILLSLCEPEKSSKRAFTSSIYHQPHFHLKKKVKNIKKDL